MYNYISRNICLNRLAKLVCVLTIFCFLATQVSWAYPVADMPGLNSEKLATTTLNTVEGKDEAFENVAMAYYEKEIYRKFRDITFFNVLELAPEIYETLQVAAEQLISSSTEYDRLPKPSKWDTGHGELRIFIGDSACLRIYFSRFADDISDPGPGMVRLGADKVLSRPLHVNFQTLKVVDPDAVEERDGGYIKKPSRKNEKGEAQKKFEDKLDKIRADRDLTGRYGPKMLDYLEEFVDTLKKTKDRALTSHRRTKLNALLRRMRKGEISVYSFNAQVVDPKNDFFLGMHDLSAGEVFFASEVMTAISRVKDKDIKESLKKQYFIHELVCEIFGHKNAIKVIDRLYPDGDLRQIIRDVIDKKARPEKSKSNKAAGKKTRGPGSRTDTKNKKPAKSPEKGTENESDKTSKPDVFKSAAPARGFDFKEFELNLSGQDNNGFVPLSMKSVKSRLSHNWFYNIPGSLRSSGDVSVSSKKAALTRISKINKGLQDFLERSGIEEKLRDRSYRIFVSGSHLWTGRYIGDLKIDIIVDGEYGFDPAAGKELSNREVKDLLGITNLNKDPASVVVNIFGTRDLVSSATAQPFPGRNYLREKLVSIPNEAVQLAGEIVDLRPRHLDGSVKGIHYLNIKGYAKSLELMIAGKSAVKRKNKSLREEIDWLTLKKNVMEEYAADHMPKDENVRGLMPDAGDNQHPVKRVKLEAKKGKALKIKQPLTATAPIATHQLMASSASEVPALVEGAVIKDRYKIIRRLGRGGFGDVWEAEDMANNGQHVAFKVMLPNFNDNEPSRWEAQKRFEREVFTLYRLNYDEHGNFDPHPNVVKMFDWYQEGDPLMYYTMEIFPAESELDKRLGETEVDEQETAELFLKIAEALELSHELGFVHRDLKPQNIMTRDIVEQRYNEETGEVEDVVVMDPVLIDFGIVKRSRAIEYTKDIQLSMMLGTIKGTPIYMSPENVNNGLEPESQRPYLITGPQPAFSEEGCTQLYDRDQIQERLDLFRTGHQEFMSNNIFHRMWTYLRHHRTYRSEFRKMSRLGVFGRRSFRKALKRVNPLLIEMFNSGVIRENPIIKDCLILETRDITFGAVVRDGILYIERPFLHDRSFEKILIGDTEQECKEDIYAFGVMLYERLTGEDHLDIDKIHRDDTTAVALARFKGAIPIEEKKRGKKISPELRAVVMKCLSLDPRERYTASELVDELERIMNDEDSQEYKELVQDEKRKKIFHRLWAGATGGAMAAIIVSLLLSEFPDSLVPSLEKPALLGVFTALAEYGLAGITGYLGTVSAVALVFGAFIMFRKTWNNYWQMESYLHKRAEFWGIGGRTLKGKVLSVAAAVKRPFRKKGNEGQIEAEDESGKLGSIMLPFAAGGSLTAAVKELIPAEWQAPAAILLVAGITVMIMAGYMIDLAGRDIKERGDADDKTGPGRKPEAKTLTGAEEISLDDPAVTEDDERHPALENIKWVLPELVYAMQGASHKVSGEKFVIAVDEDLGLSERDFEKLFSLIEEIKESNSMLFKALKNIETIRGRGEALAGRLSNLKKVKKENLIIITSKSNLPEKGEDPADPEDNIYYQFEGTSHITGIDTESLDLDEAYIPLVETILFTLARAQGFSKDKIIEIYNHIPNAAELDASEIWAKVWSEEDNSFNTRVVIELIPQAGVIRQDDQLLNDLRDYIRSNA